MNRALYLLFCGAVVCSAQNPMSGEVINTTVVGIVNDTLDNVLSGNTWDPSAALSISNLFGGTTLRNFDTYHHAGDIDENGADLYPDIQVLPGETVLLLFHEDNYYHDAVKGLVAMDLDGTRDKLVVAFDVDAQRQHNIVMKYNVQLRNQHDRLGHRMWYNMVGGIHGWNAKWEDSSEFNERRKSGVIMQATMTDDTRNKYMVRIDSKDFN